MNRKQQYLKLLFCAPRINQHTPESSLMLTGVPVNKSNKICAECWPGAAFGPCWLLTERLRYETTPLLPDPRDRVHVHGRRDVAYGSHCRGGSASGDRRAAGASREVKLSVAFECRKASLNATASGSLGRSHLGLMSKKTSPCGRLNKFQQPLGPRTFFRT